MEVVAWVAGQGRHLVILAEVQQADAALQMLVKSATIHPARQGVQSQTHRPIPSPAVIVLCLCCRLLGLLELVIVDELESLHSLFVSAKQLTSLAQIAHSGEKDVGPVAHVHVYADPNRDQRPPI